MLPSDECFKSPAFSIRHNVIHADNEPKERGGRESWDGVMVRGAATDEHEVIKRSAVVPE